MDLLRTGSKAASQARPGADDHGSMPMGRVLYAPSWTTWPGRWMHVSPTVLNCTNLIVSASAQSRAEKSVTQEIAGVCCESRVGVELRQPLGSRTGLGVRGERRGPPSRSECPTLLLAVPCPRLQHHRPRGPSPLCPREIGEWLESRPGSRTVVQLPGHHHQPLHPYSQLSLSTVLASDNVGIERAADWRVVVCPSSTGTNQVAGDPTLDICAQVQQDAPEAIERRHEPLGPCHEVGVPLENRKGARPTDPRERACGQKERGHHEVGASTEDFRRELGQVIVWSDRSTLHDTTVVGEVP